MIIICPPWKSSIPSRTTKYSKHWVKSLANDRQCCYLVDITIASSTGPPSGYCGNQHGTLQSYTWSSYVTDGDLSNSTYTDWTPRVSRPGKLTRIILTAHPIFRVFVGEERRPKWQRLTGASDGSAWRWLWNATPRSSVSLWLPGLTVSCTLSTYFWLIFVSYKHVKICVRIRYNVAVLCWSIHWNLQARPRRLSKIPTACDN